MNFNSIWEKGLLGDDVVIKGRIGWKGYKKTDLQDDGPVVIGGMNVKCSLFLNLSVLKHLSREKFDESPEIMLKKGDVLLVQRGNGIGDCGYFDGEIEEATINPTLIILSEFDGDPRFLFYYLASRIGRENVLSMSSGSSIPAIYQKPLSKLEYPKPPVKIQKNIADFLEAIDKKIELNRQTNQTLEQIAQAIFKSWFVDFEPTRAKINALENGECPERAAMAAISGKTLAELDQLPPETQQQLKTTAALFPDALVESELGDIPGGWDCSEIGKEVTVVGGGTPSTKNEAFWDGGMFHWTTPKDMSNLNDKVLIGTDRKITEAGLSKISSGLLPVNTVLMSSRAPVGYLAISKIPVAINQGYIAMKCDGALTPEYVVQWTESVMDEIKQRASGTTFAEISKKNFKVIPIVVPSTEVVHEFSKIVSNLYEKMTEALRETKSLTETRDSLLPRLLSGKMELAR